MKRTLEEEQRAMRERHKKKRRTGRPPKRFELTPVQRQLIRARIAASVLLAKGWNAVDVGSCLQVDPSAIQRWIDQGKPIFPPAYQTQNRRMAQFLRGLVS